MTFNLSLNLRHGEYVKKGNEETVVILIGWWMAKPHHLKKYVNIWHEKDISTLMFCPQDNIHFQFKTCARKLLKNLKQFNKGNNNNYTNIIFHVFSNNGCICLLEILKQAQKEQMVLKSIQGIIFDSCPGSLSPISGYGAIMAANKKKSFWYKNMMIRGVFFGIPLVLISFLWWKTQHPYIYICILFVCTYGSIYWRNRQYRHKFHTALSRLINCKCELFLYSDGDELCTADVIEQAYQERYKRFLGRKRRVISKKCFSSSPHVAHFLYYPKEYKLACWSLLE